MKYIFYLNLIKTGIVPIYSVTLSQIYSYIYGKSIDLVGPQAGCKIWQP